MKSIKVDEQVKAKLDALRNESTTIKSYNEALHILLALPVVIRPRRTRKDKGLHRKKQNRIQKFLRRQR